MKVQSSKTVTTVVQGATITTVTEILVWPDNQKCVRITTNVNGVHRKTFLRAIHIEENQCEKNEESNAEYVVRRINVR